MRLCYPQLSWGVIIILLVMGCSANPLQNPLGAIIPNPLHCDSLESGRFLQLDVTSCFSEPCSMAANTNVHFDTTFIPDRNMNSTHHRITFHPTEGIPISLLDENSSDQLNQGSTYRIYSIVDMPEAVRADRGYIKVVIANEGTTQVSRCLVVFFAH